MSLFGENAFPLRTYVRAFQGAGLVCDRVYGPWETVINAFPAVRTQAQLEAIPEARLARRIGPVGHAVIHLPGVKSVMRRRLDKKVPGRMYSFLAHRAA